MVESTNNTIKSSINEHKEKRQKKKEEKINKAKEELSENGLLDDVPSMITLPEFEHERMEITSEQNDLMINIVEEMQILSERLDSVEKRFRNLNNIQNSSQKISKRRKNLDSVKNEFPCNEREVIHLLGASLLWIVVLFGIDKFLSDNADSNP